MLQTEYKKINYIKNYMIELNKFKLKIQEHVYIKNKNNTNQLTINITKVR